MESSSIPLFICASFSNTYTFVMNESALASERGLTSEEARQRQQRFGRNELAASKKSSIITHILHVLLEPMFLLLLGAAGIYLILGEPRDAFVMLTFIVAMISIEVIQEWKTDRTLNALKDLSTPKIKVLRDGQEQTKIGRASCRERV